MLKLFSPAKINLFLKVVSKRPDGYHNLSSLFQTISLGDTLSFDIHSQDLLISSDVNLPTDSSNLILKATELFRKKTGSTQHYKIHLNKKIPTQAGLGGGSSNAATTLWACNQLTDAKIPLEELVKWASEIGSDVPFFFSQGRAHCTGRGEIIEQLPLCDSKPFWIVKPSCGLSTPEVYRHLKLSSQSERLLDGYYNDLEQPAFDLNPDLRRLKNELLQRGFETVLMSGSGSSFFCMGHVDPPQDPQLSIFPVQFINRGVNQWYDINIKEGSSK